MNALTLLTADHNRVRGLFARFSEAHESDDHQAMEQIARQIFVELAVHTQIEEEIFYPAVRNAGEQFSEEVSEAFEEHHVVKALMGEVTALQVEDEAWSAKMQVIVENVEHHASEEEQEMFREVGKAMDGDALEDLGMRLDRRKGELGAPTLADREGISTDQLKELARDQAIPGRSSMSREELMATVSPSAV